MAGGDEYCRKGTLLVVNSWSPSAIVFYVVLARVTEFGSRSRTVLWGVVDPGEAPGVVSPEAVVAGPEVGAVAGGEGDEVAGAGGSGLTMRRRRWRWPHGGRAFSSTQVTGRRERATRPSATRWDGRQASATSSGA